MENFWNWLSLILLALVVFVLGGVSAMHSQEKSIGKHCDTYGAVTLDETVYECHKR